MKLQKDILSLYCDETTLLRDCNYMKKLLLDKYEVGERLDVEAAFSYCYRQLSYILPIEYEAEENLKKDFPEFHTVLQEACIMTALSTLENLICGKQIMRKNLAYRGYPYKIPRDKVFEILNEKEKSEKTYGEHTLVKLKKEFTKDEGILEDEKYNHWSNKNIDDEIRRRERDNREYFRHLSNITKDGQCIYLTGINFSVYMLRNMDRSKGLYSM